ncbi:hypothetical protein [Kribbella sp. NBC_00359]|uniref:hypothetical protein n=1 Tax=Kribbella sp. NBC_00359 TaxID=2975966 RepID=UPI002E1F4927
MMPNVLVVGGVLACSHQGRAKLSSGDSRLTVDGNDAVVRGQEVGISFATGSPGVEAPCPFSTNAGPSPCAATLAATAGFSSKLTVGGVQVLLDTALGNATNPQDSSATWSVADPGQRKLTADE